MSLLGILTLIVWWKNIKVKSFKKILLTLFYPIHVASYVPITFVAAFRKIEWTPIKHNVVKSIREFSGNESETEKQKIEHKEVRA